MNDLHILKKSCILITLIFFHGVSAQKKEHLNGGPIYAIEKFTLSNGGGEASEPVVNFYQITGSIGQIDAGHLTSSNGEFYKVSGGFFTVDSSDDIIFKNGFE